MSDAYLAHIARKAVRAEGAGLRRVPSLHTSLKDHQRHATEFALSQGRAMLALDTGLGKSFCAFEWGRVIVEYTNKPVIMFAPLAVGAQHVREAAKWGIDAAHIREPHQVTSPRIYIANYEREHLFDPAAFGGVILDESSILKSLMGATSRTLRERWSRPQFRLACTATPAPNDYVELGQHSDFLGALTQTEMLTRWFLHDSADTGTWRLKGHAVSDFWAWVASWSRCVSKPSDLGFSDDGYILPPLKSVLHVVEADWSEDAGHDRDGQSMMFRIAETSATSIHAEKRKSADRRADAIADAIAAEPTEPWVVWVDTDYEADAITACVADAVEVRGSMRAEVKEERLDAFSTGKARVIVTKPRIGGFGLNWQHCARMAFVGLSFSWEAYYQAVRRSYRFGQSRDVAVHIAMAETERATYSAVMAKEAQNDAMRIEMRRAMSDAMKSAERMHSYNPQQKATLPAWM